MVASTTIANAIPSPSSCTGSTLARANAPKTVTIKMAAPEISGAVRASPRATDSVLLAPPNHSSRTRLRRKTS